MRFAPMNPITAFLKGFYINFGEQVGNSVAKVTVMPYCSQGHGFALLENLHTFG